MFKKRYVKIFLNNNRKYLSIFLLYKIEKIFSSYVMNVNEKKIQIN